MSLGWRVRRGLNFYSFKAWELVMCSLFNARVQCCNGLIGQRSARPSYQIWISPPTSIASSADQRHVQFKSRYLRIFAEYLKGFCSIFAISNLSFYSIVQTGDKKNSDIWRGKYNSLQNIWKRKQNQHIGSYFLQRHPQLSKMWLTQELLDMFAANAINCRILATQSKTRKVPLFSVLPFQLQKE